MRNKLFLLFVFCLILKPNISYSLVEIDITRGNLDPLPISVSPFFADEISKEKIKTDFNIDIPDWKESLRECIIKLKQ